MKNDNYITFFYVVSLGLKAIFFIEMIEVQIELNKPAAEPIKSNPEAVRKNIDGYVFGANRVKTTADRVMERILKINN